MSRIRLQSYAPLPSLKAWFPVTDNTNSIRDLKFALCSQLPILKNNQFQPSDIVLEVDDFELLDDSPADLVREADIVMLKQREIVPSETQLVKRKYDEGCAPAMAIKRRKASNKAVSSSALSSETSSASASDTRSSSSLSPSDTDSVLSSDLGPSVVSTNQNLPSIKQIPIDPDVNLSIKPKILPLPYAHTQSPPNHAHVRRTTVPPGSGKPSTQARNRRRRIKRKSVAGKSLVDPSPSSQDKDRVVNLPHDDTVSESALRTTLVPTVDTIACASSSSLGNKNKRKGFKKYMQGVISSSLVFSTQPTHTFTPPSEREVLPDNLFVTSVDVEWRTGQGGWQDAEEVANILLPDAQVPQVPAGDLRMDWKAIETSWNTYPAIESATNLFVDMVVAWKGFGLDPVTLTPQASLLHLGKIVKLDADSLTISLLTRPGSGQATFGRAVVEDAQPEEYVSTLLKEVWSNDWKLISTNH